MNMQHDIGAAAAVQPPQLDPFLSAIWQAITSDLGVLTADILGTATSLSFATSVPARMTTTVEVVVPYPTVTIDSTIFRTTFITVTAHHAPSSTPAVHSTSPTPKETLSSTTTSRSSLFSSITSSVSLPVIVTPIPNPPASDLSLSPSTGLTGSTTSSTGVLATSTPTSSDAQSQKQAIIGGLSGTIAGLVFVGILICLFLRFRRKNIDSDEASLNEKGLQSSFMRKFSVLVRGGANRKDAPPQVEDTSLDTVDEEQNVIRMNTQHWPRPFVAGEGWRDSVPPGQLRVTNPDSSRPGTPRRSSETIVGGFMRRQRSSLTQPFAAVHRSRTNSLHRHAPPQQVPEIRIDPAFPPEVAAPPRATPSFKSYPSVSSLAIVRQHPLEDPFLTPSHELYRARTPTVFEEESPSPSPPARGGAGRTLRHWASFLNPFRSRSDTTADTQTNIRAVSHFSTSTRSSRPSRRSDPFDLDRPSVRGSFLHTRIASEYTRRGQSSNWILYEGT